MTLPVLKLRRVALRDLDDAGARYAVQDPSLPGQLLAEVNSTFVRMRQRPEAFPVVHKNVRRALVHRFPFGLFFVLTGSSITVIAVVDLRRHPRTWMNRAR